MADTVYDTAPVIVEGLNPILGSAVQQNPNNKLKGTINLKAPVQSYSKSQLLNAKVKNSVGRANNFLGQNLGSGILGAVSAATDLAASFVPTQESKGKNPTGFQTQQKIGDKRTSAINEITMSIIRFISVFYFHNFK